MANLSTTLVTSPTSSGHPPMLIYLKGSTLTWPNPMFHIGTIILDLSQKIANLHSPNFVTSPTSQLILQHFCRFTYVTALCLTLPSLYLRHSSFFRFSYITGSSLTSPGETPMSHRFGRCTFSWWPSTLSRQDSSQIKLKSFLCLLKTNTGSHVYVIQRAIIVIATN